MKSFESRRQWLAAAACVATLVLIPSAGRAAGGRAASGQGSRPPAATPPSLVPLADVEVATLKWMREEEKLARDTYLTLGAVFAHPTFTNIAQSEQKHMDSVLRFLDKYAIADPALPLVGKFRNPELQALYDMLIARGSASLDEALRVGGFIEETDMIDLQEAIDATTHTDLQTMYANLLAGSVSHLQAFVGALAALGVAYVPQVLDRKTFDEIMAM